MKLSNKGLKELKELEGFKKQPYLCSAGVLTVFYGHTKTAKDYINNNLSDIEAKAIGEKLLLSDIAQFETQVNRLVQVPLTQNQFDALVLFAYNVGGGALEKSTLLKKLNAGDYDGAAKQFKRWNKANGKVIKGLTNRRKREMELFLEPSGDLEPTFSHYADGRIMYLFTNKYGRAYHADPNNEPLRNRDLPLPTAYQQHGVDSVEENKTSPAVVTAGAGGVIAGGVGITEVVQNAPAILSFLQNADWRIALFVLILVVVACSGLLIWRWWK